MSKLIANILEKMIYYSKGSRHDIEHFLKVYTYAKTIGELENLEPHEQTILEVAAILHDIACPSLREKYGHADGKLQEIEGAPLAKEFLKETELSEEQIDRVVYLVGHHHTLTEIDGLDYQILIEADFLVNACESKYSKENIANTCEKIYKTETGKRLLKSIYLEEYN